MFHCETSIKIWNDFDNKRNIWCEEVCLCHLYLTF